MISIDKNVVIRLKEGDREAFNAIFENLYLPLCKYAFSIVNDYDQAAEMAQDVFLKLWEHRQEVDEHKHLKAYLFRAVHNSCINYLKHQKVRGRYLDYLNHYADELFSDNSDGLVEQEISERIGQILASLPPKCREVFELSRNEGKKYKEIACELELAQKTVETHMSKALKLLRAGLEEFLIMLLIILETIQG